MERFEIVAQADLLLTHNVDIIEVANYIEQNGYDAEDVINELYGSTKTA